MAKGYEVWGVDDFSTGYVANIPVKAERWRRMDVCDTAALKVFLREKGFDAVVHCAGALSVEESVNYPEKYYWRNTAGTKSVLEAMTKSGTQNIVFSSTAAVYAPSDEPVSEYSRVNPTNPYGKSKLMAEQAVKASNIPYVIFRYFNVGGQGQRNGSKNLMKMAALAQLWDTPMTIFGYDYKTCDKTAVRDFIHVKDLALAHVQAVQYLINHGASETFNLGSGTGYSCLEVVNAMSRLSDKEDRQAVKFQDRRPGDQGLVVANIDKIKQKWGWAPQHSELGEIVKDTLEWFQSQGD